MTSPILSSRQNPTIQALRKRRDDSKRIWIFLEGPRLLAEVLKTHLAIDHLVVVPALFESERVKQAIARAKNVTQITPYVLHTLSDVEAPQGVIALCRRPVWDWSSILSRQPSPVVILDGLQDPGNAAAIARTAEAAGAAGIVTTAGTASLFSSKALRGAMGSTLRLPSIEHQKPEQIIQSLKEAGYGMLGTSVTQESIGYTDVDWSKPWAIVFGQEGQGLSDGWRSALSHTIRIPMKPPVESLNVAAAASILLYEANRQRG